MLNPTFKSPDQVFIVGMNGSGTTMLLDHLSSHPLLFGFPGETKFLPYFLTRASKYGDLADDRNYLKLWEDMSDSIIGHAQRESGRFSLPSDWGAPPRSVARVFDRIMGSFATEQGKRIWCEKSPMHVLHMQLLGGAFPNARFIHVIRDGRDCAASFHRRWKFNPRRTVFRWKNAVREGRRQGANLGTRYLEVRYENITREPEASLREICRFLDLPFDAAVLDTGRARRDVTSATSSRIVRNQREANQYFDAAMIEELERIAGQCLAEFGYASTNRFGDHDPSSARLRWWELGDDIRRFAVVTFRNGRIFKPRNWGYLGRRVSSALMQKTTLRDQDKARR